MFVDLDHMVKTSHDVTGAPPTYVFVDVNADAYDMIQSQCSMVLNVVNQLTTILIVFLGR